MITKPLLLVVAACALAACATPSAGPAVKVPDALKPAAGEVQVATIAARGVQVYECRARKDDPQVLEWAFVGPEAELLDANGKRVGKHYAGPHWESLDGSKIVGTVKSRADAPLPGAIPWLLLATKSAGQPGAYAKVTSIQRVNTVGGTAPSQACIAATLGQTARVAYTADYILFAMQ